LLIQAAGIAHAHGGNQLFEDLLFEVRSGDRIALIGENGAGKSTLLKIITGIYRPDEGTLEVDGQSRAFGSPRDSLHAGIGIVHQERNLIPKFSVAENITLEQPPVRNGQWIDRDRMRTESERWLDLLQIPIDPERSVEDLSVAQRQLVEIAKALSLESRILLLDEPTASLTPHETAVLFEILQRLRDDGVAILFVSHKLEEIFAICDRVTVLRDGKVAALDRDLRELDRDQLVTLMIGRSEHVAEFPQRDLSEAPVVLELRDVTSAAGPTDIDLTLRKGEILGLYGLVGAGRTELARTIIGDVPMTSGEILVDGQSAIISDARAALERYRIGYVSENRQTEGLILSHSVLANVAMTVWSRLATWLGWIQPGAERSAVGPFIDRLQVKTPSLEQQVGNLSGGNQQKVSLSKWLAAQTAILIVDEPTVGIDVKTKHELHELIWELANQGLSILLISSDMPEMVQLADRIVVMVDRRVAGSLPNNRNYDDMSQQIMSLIHRRADPPDTPA
ncbi:MAG: sugar ABC transporter ATP-binding protein, partial [Thermomicrobiales bacterium]|nr:sugar ABC transporter ATP-binding protein [Thermomicrobiales bacterium]